MRGRRQVSSLVFFKGPPGVLGIHGASGSSSCPDVRARCTEPVKKAFKRLLCGTRAPW